MSDYQQEGTASSCSCSSCSSLSHHFAAPSAQKQTLLHLLLSHSSSASAAPHWEFILQSGVSWRPSACLPPPTSLCPPPSARLCPIRRRNPLTIGSKSLTICDRTARPSSCRADESVLLRNSTVILQTHSDVWVTSGQDLKITVACFFKPPEC